MRTSPQPVLALLRGLINDYGTPQENISVGDPQRDVQNEYWDIWHTEFPNVKYICNKGGQGRTRAIKGTRPSVFFSDKGKVLGPAVGATCRSDLPFIRIRSSR